MKNTGKSFERAVQEAFTAWCAENQGFFYRFQDSYAARNLLVAQPGDFFWLIPGNAILIECKSTVSDKSLQEMVKSSPNQLAKHKLWARAGHPSVFLHYDMKEVKAYDGRAVANSIKSQPVWAGSIKQLREGVDHLKRVFVLM